MALGLPAAIGIVRGRFPGRAAILGFLMSPLLIPSVVTGLALLQFVNMLQIDSAVAALLIGHVVLTFPYVVRTIVASLEVFDWSLVETARVLVRLIRAFRRVILPSIKPGVLSGGVAFAFLTSFDNYTISIFLSDAEFRPIPVRLYNDIEEILDPSVVALCSALIFASVVILIITDRLVGIQRADQM